MRESSSSSSDDTDDGEDDDDVSVGPQAPKSLASQPPVQSLRDNITPIGMDPSEIASSRAPPSSTSTLDNLVTAVTAPHQREEWMLVPGKNDSLQGMYIQYAIYVLRTVGFIRFTSYFHIKLRNYSNNSIR